MEIVKKYIVGIVILVVIIIIWLGLLFVSERSFSDINPNASTYVKPLGRTFDTETLERVSERTRNSFPVSPSEFFNLTGED